MAGAWILATDFLALCALRSTERRSGGVLRDSIHRLALVAGGPLRASLGGGGGVAGASGEKLRVARGELGSGRWFSHFKMSYPVPKGF